MTRAAAAAAQHPPLPDVTRASTVVTAPGDGPGYWAGAPSAVLADGVWWLAYRLRRPIGLGRGIGVTLARSDDGVRFEPVGEVPASAFGAASLERPALVRRPDGGWRLYVSCATPGSKHWRIDALDAATPAELPAAGPVVVLAGDERVGVKDPVVEVDGSGWRMWVCCHPLDVPGAEDRMLTRLATSADGLRWELGDPVLAPPDQGWTRRGTRVTAVFASGAGAAPVLYFDGRASAEENWCERTGLAVPGPDGRYRTVGDAPAAGSPYPRGALRYLTVVPLPAGGHRLYFEAARPDGAHDLFTQVVGPVAPRGAAPVTPGTAAAG